MLTGQDITKARVSYDESRDIGRMTPDQYRREGAEAMREAAARILDHYDEYDRQLCCDGQMCGCQGSTVHQMIQHFIRAIDVDGVLAGLSPTTPDTKSIRAQMDALEGFTPGPWMVSPTDDTTVINRDRNVVAEIDGDYNEPDLWSIMEYNARLIAAAPDMRVTILALCDAWDNFRAENDAAARLVDTLCNALDAERAENERLRCMLRDGCDLMAIEVEALKSGISINGEMRPGPEDQNAVDAINELEEWIDRAGRAALGQEGNA